MVFETRDLGGGNYELKEVDADLFEPPSLGSGNRKEFHYNLVYGFGVTGYVDLDEQEIGVWTTFLGKKIGSMYTASLKTGLTIKIDVKIYHGSIRLFKSGNSLKIKWDIGAFGHDKSGEATIIRW